MQQWATWKTNAVKKGWKWWFWKVFFLYLIIRFGPGWGGDISTWTLLIYCFTLFYVGREIVWAVLGTESESSAKQAKDRALSAAEVGFYFAFFSLFLAVMVSRVTSLDEVGRYEWNSFVAFFVYTAGLLLFLSLANLTWNKAAEIYERWIERRRGESTKVPPDFKLK